MNPCKICGGTALDIVAHTAHCVDCGVLLYFPYPPDNSAIGSTDAAVTREGWLEWYNQSSFFNHSNFTNMLRFTMDESHKGRELHILDYGGGGGQFALVCKSHFPQAKMHYTDMVDASLLDEWRPIMRQIFFRDFASDTAKFDFIFMNDVFEHVSDPVGVLRQLSEKLLPGGVIFVDTPIQFWIYPLTRAFHKQLYVKVLRGTVSRAHLQIWSRRAFDMSVAKASLRVHRYRECSEFTMPVDFYLRNMRIENPVIRAIAKVFYRFAKYMAHNKIMAVLARVNA
jgi:ubiquinone/menaquinone biosynthesis C-methylase UbiE